LPKAVSPANPREIEFLQSAHRNPAATTVESSFVFLPKCNKTESLRILAGITLRTSFGAVLAAYLAAKRL